MKLERLLSLLVVAVTVAVNWPTLLERAAPVRQWWHSTCPQPGCDPPGWAQAHRELYDDLRPPAEGAP